MATLKYEQIKEYLKAEALKPEAISGMPSVRTLMRRFNVAMATVNQALIELEHEKVIIRQQGRGIIAARAEQLVCVLPEDREKPLIILAFPDYPAETLWGLAYTTEQYALQNGFGVMTYKIRQDTTCRALADLVGHCPNCAALLIIPPAERYSYEALEQFGHLPVPVVLIDCLFYYDDLPENVYNLSHDPAVAGELMAACLLEHGHTGIGYVRNDPRTDFGDLKQNAFVKTLKKNGISIPSSHIFSEAIRSWESSMAAAQQIVGKNLSSIRKLGITALAFTSSPGAFAAVQTLAKAGFDVPGEISVIGEGESIWFGYGDPALTVLSANYSELGCRAVNIAAGKFREEHLFYCSQKLIVRNSVSFVNNKPKKGKGK